jgi:hypothetical protein
MYVSTQSLNRIVVETVPLNCQFNVQIEKSVIYCAAEERSERDVYSRSEDLHALQMTEVIPEVNIEAKLEVESVKFERELPVRGQSGEVNFPNTQVQYSNFRFCFAILYLLY